MPADLARGSDRLAAVDRVEPTPFQAEQIATAIGQRSDATAHDDCVQACDESAVAVARQSAAAE
jgi:hypothetical protein